MRPFRRVEPRTLATALGVAFDVDDTVTRHGKLEWEALAAMHALRREGFLLVAATGRPLGWADVWIRQWPIDVAVAENGAAFLVSRDGSIEEGALVGAEDARARRAACVALVADRMPHVRLAGDSSARRYDVAFDIAEAATLPPEDVEALDALLREAGFHTTRSTVHLHAMLSATDKARGIARALAVSHGFDDRTVHERFLFVGDSINDGPAFAAFDTSVGVANVRRSMPPTGQRPKFVTEAEHGHGFGEVARELVAARRAADEVGEEAVDEAEGSLEPGDEEEPRD